MASTGKHQTVISGGIISVFKAKIAACQ